MLLKEKVHVFAGQVKIVSHLFCRTSEISKYFVPSVELLHLIYLNAKVLQPFNICIFFSMVQVRIFIKS